MHKTASKPARIFSEMSYHWQSWGTDARSPKLYFKSCHANLDDSR